MKLIKFIIVFLSIIILLLFSIGLIVAHNYLIRNDMESCMYTYRDYDYCKVIGAKN